jgi:hypothetical protein
LGAREARENFVRTSEIELGNARIKRKNDGELCSHSDLLGSRLKVGFLAGRPCCPQRRLSLIFSHGSNEVKTLWGAPTKAPVVEHRRGNIQRQRSGVSALRGAASSLCDA